MNASAQALSVGVVSKIANISNIFQAQYPATLVDFSPWVIDEKTQKEFDPNSLDLSFSFPRWETGLNCGCVLMQIYFFGELQSSKRILNKIKLTGHDYRGQNWRFSTHADWKFSGLCVPSSTDQQKLKLLVSELHILFGAPVSSIS